MSIEITAAVLRQSGDQPRPYADGQPLELAALTLDDPKAGELLVRIDAAGLYVVYRMDAEPTHGKAQDSTDPLHAARSAEVTSLWRLKAKA